MQLDDLTLVIARVRGLDGGFKDALAGGPAFAGHLDNQYPILGGEGDQEDEAYLGVIVTAGLSASLVANWLSMRIYEQRPLVDIGLRWNGLSVRNLLYGIAGGAGGAALVLGLPLAVGAARIHASSRRRNELVSPV